MVSDRRHHRAAALVAAVVVGGAFLLIIGSRQATPTLPTSAPITVGLPNPVLTPGATNPAVTQATIGSTICLSGWTATIRPPATYTTDLKRRQLADPRYGDTADQSTGAYEEDHLIALELGGNPTASANLWPEPYVLTVNGIDLGAHAKDKVESLLRERVCSGALPLADAQHEIATNWEAVR